MVATQDTVKRSNVFQIIKKSGDAVLFDEMKLQRSVERALLATGIETNPIASQLVDDIIKKLEEELSYRENITTLDISEAVEISLLERGLTNVASTYHDFRNTKAPQNDLDSSSSESPAVNPAMSKLADLITRDNNPSEISKEKIKKKTNSNKKNNLQNSEKQTLPDERQSFTYRFSLEDCSGYITVSMFENGLPGEIILHSVKSEKEDVVDVVYLFLSVINTSLQYGVPISDIVDEILNKKLKKEDLSVRLLIYICEWIDTKF